MTTNGIPQHISLAAIKKGRLNKPARIVLYGGDGVGKSTFAASAPSPIFICPEDGTAQLDVSRFPEPTTWGDVIASVQVLTDEKHEYQTLVIDTLDWLEPLCWSHVCALNGWENIKAPGWGDGYQAAVDQWRLLLARIDRLRAAKNIGVIFLAHNNIRQTHNPEGSDYDRYHLKLNEKAAGLVREWSDCVLYAAYETFTVKDNGKTRGVSNGARVLYTERTAAFDAKSRYDMPKKMPLAWADFSAALQASTPDSPDKIRARITAMLASADAEVQKRVTEAVTAASNSAKKLARIADHLAATLNTATTEQPSSTDAATTGGA